MNPAIQLSCDWSIILLLAAWEDLTWQPLRGAAAYPGTGYLVDDLGPRGLNIRSAGLRTPAGPRFRTCV
jgi:hypothetical protein